MRIIAYIYSDLLLESSFARQSWGWGVDCTYHDLGQRTELQKLIADCKTQPADYLLIRRVDELGDSLAEVSDRLHQLESIGITTIATEQGYTSDLLKLLQEIQRQHRSRSIRLAHAHNRLQGAPPPGKAPYGYRRSKEKYTIDRSTATVVKDFFEQFLLYGSLRGAVRYLARKYGKKISVTTGRRWLTNPVYRGDTAYQNDEIISDTHTPIISRDEAAQIDRILRRNSRLPSRTASAPRSLAGLVVCGECQSHTTVTRVKKRNQDQEYLYLRPISCIKNPKCRAIPYQEVLENTIKTICRDLPLAVAEMDFPQLDAIKKSLEQAIARQQEILQQLPALVESGVLDDETAKLRVYKLRTEISQLQAKLATLPPVNLSSVAQAVSIPQFWFDLSEAERRFYFREFIKQIEIIGGGKNWEVRIIFIF
ncbi:recombinase family protein [Chrysosporum bergii ANA360D]|jgi:DNA invertase Pin-like site-specific DNA recombinase/predicted metal-binding protein|uniref:Recombinase family protein n=1 Tax=Chrysosporum bergii ANA360D TaxID=617107 RepID=A0AA43GUR2_9CYAN|nr:recombinase family protein [Chrysosporum bergii]MDH6062044.1 recombinase family protein [Chrysosporum bergii ANA360D]